MDQTSPPVAVPLGRASVVPRSVSLSPRTGEPRRPWVAWVVLALETIGTGLVGAALLWGMWLSVHHFAEASWLQGAVPTQIGDHLRLLLVLAVWVASVLIGAVAMIAGYYAWRGYRWSRWATLVALAVGGLSFLGHWLAPWSLVPLALAAGLVWLPPMRRFYADWWQVRQPRPAAPPRTEPVVYGPLPRYDTIES